MEKTSEGGLSWTMQTTSPTFWVGGEIRFDYYEGEVRRVMFYVTELRMLFGSEIDRIEGLNGTWLYRE